MTIDDEIQLMPATTGDGAIVPEARYTLELVRCEKAPPSTFKPEAGPQIKWVFNLYDASGELFYFQNEPYEFFRHTSRANSPRAYARQYAEALLGRKLGDQEVPSLVSLYGLRMSALISYEPSSSDASREVLKLGSLKHIPIAPAQTPVKQPTQVSAEPSDEDVDRALLVTKLQKSVARLKKLDSASGAAAQAAVDESDLGTAPLDEIERLVGDVSSAINKALAD